jgi:hypothetical protein
LQSLKVPPEVRIFWWRVIQNFLPSNAELTRRHIRERGHCTACGNESESLYHVMVQCPGAKKFWSEVKKLTGQKLPDLHPLTWATDATRKSLLASRRSCLCLWRMVSMIKPQ